MTEHCQAVALILDRLKTQGEEWFRNAVENPEAFLRRPTAHGYGLFDGKEIHTIGHKPKSSFPDRKFLLIESHAKEDEAVLGLWLRWNFDTEPFEFRLFLGQWSLVEKQETFVAFRFEAPETGEEHNYYHCQPCRNFGNKVAIERAAMLSERFPTIPVNAANIVELTICTVLAAFGRKKTKQFLRKVLSEGAGRDNAALVSAYARLVA